MMFPLCAVLPLRVTLFHPLNHRVLVTGQYLMKQKCLQELMDVTLWQIEKQRSSVEDEMRSMKKGTFILFNPRYLKWVNHNQLEPRRDSPENTSKGTVSDQCRRVDQVQDLCGVSNVLLRVWNKYTRAYSCTETHRCIWKVDFLVMNTQTLATIFED